MGKRQTLNHIVLLRAMAIVLVVLGHATRDSNSPNLHMYSPSITPLFEVLLKDYIYSFHMPLFFWVSGYVFYFSSIENGKRNEVLSQLIKKARRLILPMYATSFLVLLPTILLFGSLNGSLVSQIKLFLLGLDNDHLWFLKALFTIFVVVIPVFSWRQSDHWRFYTFLTLLWLIAFVSQPLLPENFASYPIEFFPFFLIGLLSRKYEKFFPKINNLFYAMGLFLMHALALGCIFVLRKLGLATFISASMVLEYIIALLGIAFLYFFAQWGASKIASRPIWALVKAIDVRSYSIYLFHVTFLYITLFLAFKLSIDSALLRILVAFVSGMVFPMLMHDGLARVKYIPQMFSIPYKWAKRS